MINTFSRTELLMGKQAIARLNNSKVAVFGIGGVGSFAAEALARSGIGHLILVDYDVICVSNINRQIHATYKTLGRPKVEVMAERIHDINPRAGVTALHMMYCESTATSLINGDMDYVIDAMDMVSAKTDLIVRCKSAHIPIISSMGAGNKMCPTLLRVADIYQTSVCPLARVMRRELRAKGVETLKVVYSTEKPHKPDEDSMKPENSDQRVIGSTSFVPPAAGLVLAAEVVNDLVK